MPATIRQLLNRLANRERLLGFIWAAARVVTVCLLLLIVCCGLDWLLDRWGATPFVVRVLMFVTQAGVAVAGLGLIALPLLRRWSDDALALWIEERVPTLGHRLISAVQFNRPGAKTMGMSADLIAATTRQAEQQAASVDLATVCDSGRLKQALFLLTPALILTVGLYLSMPSLAGILLSRQLLGDEEIPRRVNLKSITRPVWATGEEGIIRLESSGLYDGEEPNGIVRITPDVGRPFTLPLTREGTEFIAKVPPSEGKFTFEAWLADGRLRNPGAVRYAARPIVQVLRAWVQIPTTLIKKADGSPFEEEQRGGDVQYRLDGSQLRIAITSQVPLQSALVSFGGEKASVASFTLSADGLGGEGLFPIRDSWTGYTVRLVSRDDLEGIDPPRRTVRRIPLDPPEVTLLAETFFKKGDRGTADDWEVEGIPVLEGERFRTDYRAGHRYGLSHARMRFRVIPLGTDDDGSKIDADRFSVLPLGPGRGAGATASMELRREFGTLSVNDLNAPPETEARGTYDFNVGSLPDGKGGTMRLKRGDRIQFYVEVFSKAAPDGPPGRSVIREKEIVDEKGYFTWLERKDDLKERARSLEESARTARPGGQ